MVFKTIYVEDQVSTNGLAIVVVLIGGELLLLLIVVLDEYPFFQACFWSRKEQFKVIKANLKVSHSSEAFSNRRRVSK